MSSLTSKSCTNPRSSEARALYFTVLRSLKSMKRCSGPCKTSKPLHEFNKRGSGLQTWCRLCNAARSRQYYAENREKHKRVIREQTLRYIKRNQDWIVEYLRQHPCCDCRESDIVVLEFDHRSDKLGNISNMVCEPVSLARLQVEVAKCDVVCANCHRRRTAKTQNHYKHLAGVANVGFASDF